MRSSSISAAIAGASFAAVLIGAVHALRAADPPRTFAPGETLSSAKLNESFSVLANRVDALERTSGGNGVPAGTVIAFAGAAVPAGWLLCDGTAYDRVVEATLFGAIGTAWGAPDATKFNVPDLRGRFLRGVDQGAGRDPDAPTRNAVPGGNGGDAVGSVQGDEIRAHQHTILLFAEGILLQGGTPTPHLFFNGGGPGLLATQPNPGQETRPKNANVVYAIKR